MVDPKIEALAKAVWTYYYPNGGSIYKTYDALPFHDKQCLSSVATELAAVLDGAASVVLIGARCDRVDTDPLDAIRFAYLYSGTKTGSNALIEIEMRMLDGDVPTLDEVRAAVDECMKTPDIQPPKSGQHGPT